MEDTIMSIVFFPLIAIFSVYGYGKILIRYIKTGKWESFEDLEDVKLEGVASYAAVVVNFLIWIAAHQALVKLL